MSNISIEKENIRVEGNSLVIELTEELKTQLGINLVPLNTLNIGDIFEKNGIEWYVVSKTENSIDVWRKEFLEETMRFDEKSNDFRESEIEEYLNTTYMQEEAIPIFGAENILEKEIDLTSLDGLATYGTYKTKIHLGTFDDYRNARKNGMFREENDKSFWLDTPNSTEEGVGNSCVRVVYDDGRVRYYGCGWNCGVRPFISLNPTILVSLKK